MMIKNKWDSFHARISIYLSIDGDDDDNDDDGNNDDKIDDELV